MLKVAQKKVRKPEVFMMRLTPQGMIPADTYTRDRMQLRAYRPGDLIACSFRKPNNTRFHRLLHQLGVLCAENIESFHGMQAHNVLKRLQFEGNIACDEIGVMLPDGTMATMLFPVSLAYDSIDDGERHEIGLAMSRYIAQVYWPQLDAEQILDMATVMVNE